MFFSVLLLKETVAVSEVSTAALGCTTEPTVDGRKSTAAPFQMPLSVRLGSSVLRGSWVSAAN